MNIKVISHKLEDKKQLSQDVTDDRVYRSLLSYFNNYMNHKCWDLSKNRGNENVR